ncbi:hypothetical protein [Streptomyces scabiei]|uniref:hypothetical protein n=1 Tax=Streptomyces scabiei TaxID=1930 RepID=UPI0029BC9A90|nr:hypothetical protein [Streptomyces scabiei]MDX3205076.1 hypothetical protein [Streptomyces scabiei]
MTPNIHAQTAPAADDEVVTAPLAMLRAAAVHCLPDGDSGGYYAVVPLADGTRITFAGTTVNRDSEHPDVSIHHPVRDHDSWSAQWSDGGNAFADVYDSRDQPLAYEADTAALVDAVLRWIPRHGGSAPKEGVGETAEQLATTALAEWGITAHTDGDAGNTWLVISSDQAATTLTATGRVPYVLLSLHNSDDDEWVLDRPPVRPADRWKLLTGDGTGAEQDWMTQPVDQFASCVEAIADWLTKPQAATTWWVVYTDDGDGGGIGIVGCHEVPDSLEEQEALFREFEVACLSVRCVVAVDDEAAMTAVLRECDPAFRDQEQAGALLDAAIQALGTH